MVNGPSDGDQDNVWHRTPHLSTAFPFSYLRLLHVSAFPSSPPPPPGTDGAGTPRPSPSGTFKMGVIACDGALLWWVWLAKVPDSHGTHYY